MIETRRTEYRGSMLLAYAYKIPQNKEITLNKAGIVKAFSDTLTREESMAKFMQIHVPSFYGTIDLLVGDVLVGTGPNAYLETAMAAKMGEEHQNRFIDLNGENYYAKLAEVKNAAATADFTGLSDAEKYAAIYDRYAQAFGKDFCQSASISYPADHRTSASEIRFWFNKELKAVLGSDKKIEAARRTAQYGSMSDQEIRAAIKDKYAPADDEMTLREFYYMVWEMDQAGVADGLSKVLRRTETTTKFVREELLDKPLDLKRLCDTYNMMCAEAFKSSNNYVGIAGSVIQEVFDVNVNSKGNLYTQSNLFNSEELMRQIEKKYQSWTANDYKEWLYTAYQNRIWSETHGNSINASV